MTLVEDRLLAAFPGSEIIAVDEDLVDEVCTWSGCPAHFPDDVLITIGERKDTWCLTHVSDEALPRVLSTDRGLRACQQCGRGTAQMLEDGTPIHDTPCRRNLTARRASGSKPKGAYARRRRG